jgi:hypothetical protein
MPDDQHYRYAGQYCRIRAIDGAGERYVTGTGFVVCDSVTLQYRAIPITKAAFQQGVMQQVQKAKPSYC